jgi:LysM repeat protein
VNTMKKIALGLLIALIAVAANLLGLSSAMAAPQLQEGGFITPTPGADGRILYTVQSGDTLYGISVATGVSVEELRQLNNMGENDTLIAGATIVIGIDSGVLATAQASHSARPTPTAIIDSAMVCVLLYLDVNADAVRQADEIPMADGQISINEQTGLYARQGTTTYALDGLCFMDLPPGTYDVAMTLPADYYPTTELAASLELSAGDTAYFSFGMSPDPDVKPPNPPTDQPGFDPILAIGGVLLMIGAGVGIYAALANRGSFSEGD